jgi:hypothetical protein
MEPKEAHHNNNRKDNGEEHQLKPLIHMELKEDRHNNNRDHHNNNNGHNNNKVHHHNNRAHHKVNGEVNNKDNHKVIRKKVKVVLFVCLIEYCMLF